MLALLEHPDQLARLRDDPGLLPTAIDEILRWVTPVTCFARTATEDVEIRGQQISTGDMVAMWFTSADRDESVFVDPYRFDVGRTPNKHVAFGAGGPHFCLGAALARMELRVMFELLIERLADIELTGPIVRQRSNLVRGIVSMPVRVRGR
jgi:cholest-4-en-3-one 26-monooxygenase